MEFVAEGLNWKYTSVEDEGMPWDKEEQQYLVPNAVFDDTGELLLALGFEGHDDFRQDIVDSFDDRVWCERDFASLSRNNVLSYGWDSFVETIKYNTRFFFTVEPPSPESDDHEVIPVHRMMDAIGDLVTAFNLVETVKAGQRLYRVRVADKTTRLEGVADLGPPPRECAMQPNRMSPSGIVMFYGTFDRMTALFETFQANRGNADQKSIWIATFRTLRPLLLLDLTRLPRIPSLFDPDHRHEIDDVAFLHGLVEDLVEPIERDGREHIDYVPTQIVTEYFRRQYQHSDGRALDGIVYRSSKANDGCACVLFITGEDCGVPLESWMEREQVLEMLADKTEVIDGTVAASEMRRHAP